MDYVYCPMVNTSLGIMQTMNPIVDSLIPSDALSPVENMQPYFNSPQIGSVQDALQILQVTDLLFG
jgi:hypothetical protein